jgi:hypothetical protein
MMPLFNVFVEGAIVIFAPNEEAINSAISSDIVRDDSHLTVVSVSRIESEKDLCEQWEPECLPYGLPPDDFRSIRGILRAETQ